MAESVVLYAVPTVPLGRLVVVMESGEAIDTLRPCDACCAAESVTRTVKLYDPAAVGVPEIVPEVLSVRPVGRLPTAKVQV